jgi:hypothetical protein
LVKSNIGTPSAVSLWFSSALRLFMLDFVAEDQRNIEKRGVND